MKALCGIKSIKGVVTMTFCVSFFRITNPLNCHSTVIIQQNQFFAEYDEAIVTAEGHVASGSQDAVDSGNYHYQLPVSPYLISETQLSSSSSSSGNRDQTTTTGHNEQVVVSLPTNNAGEEPSFYPVNEAFEHCLPILVSSPLPQNKVA